MSRTLTFNYTWKKDSKLTPTTGGTASDGCGPDTAGRCHDRQLLGLWMIVPKRGRRLAVKVPRMMVMTGDVMLLLLLGLLAVIYAGNREAIVGIGLDSWSGPSVQVQQFLGACPVRRADIGEDNPVGRWDVLGDHLGVRNWDYRDCAPAGHLVYVSELLLFLMDVVLVVVAVTSGCGNHLELCRRAVKRLSEPVKVIHLWQRQVTVLADLVYGLTWFLVRMVGHREPFLAVLSLQMSGLTMLLLVVLYWNHYRAISATATTTTGHHRKRGCRSSHVH